MKEKSNGKVTREVLKIHRKERGITQAEVAKELGLARCSYTLIENG